uniref:Nucleotide-diphospho-sugar transferase n=1 Tax=Pithovirus LCPAC403 TaxID=2506596 RepID=A0A481ZAP2_9VIRU|nr:MAG: nucleotide-diphospho-sugar transferase [Pithovirus LCPAC403]
MDRLLVSENVNWTRKHDIILVIGSIPEGLELYDIYVFNSELKEAFNTHVKLLNPLAIISDGDEYDSIESCSYLKWYRGLFVLSVKNINALNSNMRICTGGICNTKVSEKEMILLKGLGIIPTICTYIKKKYKCVFKSYHLAHPEIVWRNIITCRDVSTIYITPDGKNTSKALLVLSTGNSIKPYMKLDNLMLVVKNLEIFDQYFLVYQIMIYNDDDFISSQINISEWLTIKSNRRIEITRNFGPDLSLEESSPVTIIPSRKVRKHLIVQYYRDNVRQSEIDECLKRNLENNEIDRVHVLTEVPIQTEGLVTNIGERMTWKSVTKYISDTARASIHPNDVCIVANSDIYFDSSLSKIPNLNGIVLSLLRYNVTSEKTSLFGTDRKANEYHPAVIHGASQDCWIFEASAAKCLRGDLEFCCGGEPLCDSKINYIFQDSGYMVINPCYEIISYHLHESKVRKYKNSTLKGPYRIIHPNTLGCLYPPSDKTIVLTYCTEGYTKYTINLFRSMKQNLVAVCPDEKTCKILRKEGIDANRMIPLSGYRGSKHEIWGTKEFGTLTIEKLRIIHHYLTYGHNIIYTDGDIVWLKDFSKELLDELNNCDILFQNDFEYDRKEGELCTGMLCVKSNSNTIKLFDPRYLFDVDSFRDDQSYLNRRIGYIKSNDPVVSVVYKILKRDMYPNGSVFLSNPKLKETAMIVHMNHCIGSTKWENLKKYGLIFS